MEMARRQRIGKWGMTAGAVMVIGAVSVTVTRVVAVHVQAGAFTLALVLSIAMLAVVLWGIPRLFKRV